MRVPSLPGRAARSALAFFFFLLSSVVLIAGTPSAAQAAVRYSGGIEVSEVVSDSFLPRDTVECSMGFQYRVYNGIGDDFAQWIDFKGTCADDATDIVSSVGMSMDFSFAGSTGAGSCMIYEQTKILMGDDGPYYSGTVLAALNKPANQLCAVTEICYRFHGELEVHALPNRQVDNDGCFQLGMGTPEVPKSSSGDCDLLTANKPTASILPSVQYGATMKDLKITVTAAKKVANTGNWFHYTIYRNAGSNTNVVYAWDANGRPFTEGQSLSTQINFSGIWYTNNVGSVVGQGMFSMDKNPLTTGTTDYPQNYGNGLRGVTDPSKCSFYWGEKVALTPNDTRDEPIAGLAANEPPEDGPQGQTPIDPAPITTPTEEPGCSFSITDPASWLDGGMCATVGFLMEIWNTLGTIAAYLANLAGAIVMPIVDAIALVSGAILDGLAGALSSLFVPPHGHLDSKTTEVRAAWSDTTPAKWADSVSDMGLGDTPSGCSGVRVEVPLPGYTIDERLGAACSGKMADVAGLVRAALTLTVAVAGAFACMRAVGSGFGWESGVGRGQAA